MKTRWDRKTCGCVKTNLSRAGKVRIRCERHRDKSYKGKRTLCYWDEHGLVRSR